MGLGKSLATNYIVNAHSIVEGKMRPIHVGLASFHRWFLIGKRSGVINPRFKMKLFPQNEYMPPAKRTASRVRIFNLSEVAR